MVYARFSVRTPQRLINMLFPAEAPCRNQRTLIPFAFFRAEAVLTYTSCCEEDVSMNVAFVAAGVSGMDRNIGDHASAHKSFVYERVQ